MWLENMDILPQKLDLATHHKIKINTSEMLDIKYWHIQNLYVIHFSNWCYIYVKLNNVENEFKQSNYWTMGSD